MTDYSDLIARLRRPRTKQGGLWPIPNLHEEAADALEAQVRRIAELEAALTDIADAWDTPGSFRAQRYALRTALDKSHTTLEGE
ncbi:hypothetical protein [Caudoviricetes sp.]|nr:hypothetical protein [Caudoviricetes sp.]UOF81522.1 hypothetical protein [Caudoviricetes sp.]